MTTIEGEAVEALCRRLRQAEPENRPVKKCQDFCGQGVYVSELANSQFEVSELQMSSKVVLGVSKVDRSFKFWNPLFLR